MPVIKSAKKKLRQDKKRQQKNRKTKENVKDLLKKARRNPTRQAVREAVSLVDKAAKKHIFHANKAARMKSSLAKLLVSKEKSTPAKKGRKIPKSKRIKTK